jgi:hypothetical protein
MAYFPNGTSHDLFAEHWCERCVHWPEDDESPLCVVETAHFLYNYELCNKKDDPGKVILEMLIPMEETPVGSFAGKCAMFWERTISRGQLTLEVEDE